VTSRSDDRPFRARFLRAFALLIAGSLVFAACGSSGSDDQQGSGPSGTSLDEPTSGGTLRWAVSDEVDSWTPTVMEVGDRGSFVYDTLLAVDENGQWQPHMADMSSDDGTTWTMTLQDDIEFTDGTPLDAEAVKFTIELFLDPDQGSDFRALLTDITEMNVLDAQTLEIVLKEPNGPFPFAFTHLPGMVVSPTAFKADPEGFAEKPVGAGPFTVERWVRDSSTTFARNPNYWGPPAHLDAIETVVIPDESSRGQALASGEVDVAWQVGYQIEQAVAGNDGFYRANADTNGAEAIAPNQDNPPFDDVRIREALALAIDLSVVNETLMFGTWDEERFTCPPFGAAQPECLTGAWPDPDPDRARELVAEYEAEKGPLTGGYELLIVAQKQPIAELLQQMWSAVGIDVDITGATGADYAQRLANQSYDLGNNIIISFIGPSRSLYRNMFSHERSGRHVQGGPVDAELEEIMDTALTAVDEEERNEAAREFQRRNAEEFLNIWYLPSGLGIVANSDVKVPASWSGAFFTRPSEIWLDR
jgi:peptide/nickel transport system substrate-binding protein